MGFGKDADLLSTKLFRILVAVTVTVTVTVTVNMLRFQTKIWIQSWTTKKNYRHWSMTPAGEHDLSLCQAGGVTV